MDWKIIFHRCCKLNPSAALCLFPLSRANVVCFHFYGVLSYYYWKGDNNRSSWLWLAVNGLRGHPSTCRAPAGSV